MQGAKDRNKWELFCYVHHFGVILRKVGQMYVQYFLQDCEFQDCDRNPLYLFLFFENWNSCTVKPRLMNVSKDEQFTRRPKNLSLYRPKGRMIFQGTNVVKLLAGNCSPTLTLSFTLSCSWALATNWCVADCSSLLIVYFLCALTF